MADMKICDPHMHFWDVPKHPNENLGGIGQPGGIPLWYPKDYFAAMKSAGDLRSAVHVETIVGQKEGGMVLDPVGETKWLASLEGSLEGMPMSVVAYAHLGRPDVNDTLEQHRSAHSKLRGIRMILNHHPEDSSITWPQVEHGRFLQDSAFRHGFGLLQTHALSFDLQANPHQLQGAAELFAQFPGVPVAVNHMACLRLAQGKEADDAALATWRQGMQSLAALSHVSVKISMLDFCQKDWWKTQEGEAQVAALVQEVIGMFGYERCMFASNMPVDQFVGGADFDIGTVYTAFRRMTHRYGSDGQALLFHDNAAKFYGLRL